MKTRRAKFSGVSGWYTPYRHQINFGTFECDSGNTAIDVDIRDIKFSARYGLIRRVMLWVISKVW